MVLPLVSCWVVLLLNGQWWGSGKATAEKTVFDNGGDGLRQRQRWQRRRRWWTTARRWWGDGSKDSIGQWRQQWQRWQQWASAFLMELQLECAWWSNVNYGCSSDGGNMRRWQLGTRDGECWEEYQFYSRVFLMPNIYCMLNSQQAEAPCIQIGSCQSVFSDGMHGTSLYWGWTIMQVHLTVRWQILLSGPRCYNWHPPWCLLYCTNST